MLPVALVVGVATTLIIKRFSWRTRAAYTLNLAVLAFVSLMVFLPLLHYWTEYPEDYLRRTSTRMFGDAPTSPGEQLQILGERVPVLLSNLRNALLEFHYTFESTWVTAVPGEPAMDTTTAAFMLLGVAAWLTMMVKTRDPVIWFIPILLFFMLLVSALALSFPIEVPSFTRASGAIAPAYLIAALPVVIICRLLWSSLPKPLGPALAVVFSGRCTGFPPIITIPAYILVNSLTDLRVHRTHIRRLGRFYAALPKVMAIMAMPSLLVIRIGGTAAPSASKQAKCFGIAAVHWSKYRTS